MPTRMITAGAVLLLLSAAPALAQVKPAPAADQSLRPAALALAELVAPSDLLIPMEVANAKLALSTGFQSQPDGKKLVQEHPQLMDALWAAIEPEVRKSCIDDQPKFAAGLAGIYAAHLTAAEIETLRKFYSTSTGRKLIRQMYGNIDAQPALASALENKGSKISEEALAKMQRGAVAKAVAGIGPEDEPALKALMSSISISKMKAVGEITQKFTADWVNREDPAFDARMDELLAAALEKFFSEQG